MKFVSVALILILTIMMIESSRIAAVMQFLSGGKPKVPGTFPSSTSQKSLPIHKPIPKVNPPPTSQVLKNKVFQTFLDLVFGKVTPALAKHENVVQKPMPVTPAQVVPPHPKLIIPKSVLAKEVNPSIQAIKTIIPEPQVDLGSLPGKDMPFEIQTQRNVDVRVGHSTRSGDVLPIPPLKETNANPPHEVIDRTAHNAVPLVVEENVEDPTVVLSTRIISEPGLKLDNKNREILKKVDSKPGMEKTRTKAESDDLEDLVKDYNRNTFPQCKSRMKSLGSVLKALGMGEAFNELITEIDILVRRIEMALDKLDRIVNVIEKITVAMTTTAKIVVPVFLPLLVKMFYQFISSSVIIMINVRRKHKVRIARAIELKNMHSGSEVGDVGGGQN